MIAKRLSYSALGIILLIPGAAESQEVRRATVERPVEWEWDREQEWDDEDYAVEDEWDDLDLEHDPYVDESWGYEDDVGYDTDYRDRRRGSKHGSVAVRGRVNVNLGPIRSSVRVGDSSYERAIRACQRQTRRSRSWCQRRIQSDRNRSAWARVRWNQVFIQPPRNAHRRQNIGRRDLRYVLDPWVLDRIQDHGRRIGIRGNLRGRWIPDYRYGSRMEIRMDGILVARIYDLDGDCRADDILLRRRY